MKNFHVMRRAKPAASVKIGWNETLPMRVKALGRDYPKLALRTVLLYVKAVGGLIGVLVVIRWCSGQEAWFGGRGVTAMGLAVCSGAVIGLLVEMFPRFIRMEKSMLTVRGAPIEYWALASIVAVRSKVVSERVVRIEVDIDEGGMKTVVVGVRAAMAGRVVEELKAGMGGGV